MSYNGVGLQTARGSGTSGYVETSLAAALNKSQSVPDELVHGHYKRRKLLQQEEERRQQHAEIAHKKMESQAEIYEHNSKRRIDLKCAELRDQLEDESEDDLVIAQRVDALRQILSTQAEHDEKPVITDSEVVDATGDPSTTSNKEEPQIIIKKSTGPTSQIKKDANPTYEPRHGGAVNPRVRRQ